MSEMRETGDGERLVREVVLMIAGSASMACARRGTRPTNRMKHVVLAIALLCTGCGPSEPLNVFGVQTGKSLNSDHSVATHAASFRPNDVMYVSVLSAGRGAGTITVTWAFGGRVIQTLKKKVSYNGQAATDFRFEAADDFPIGDYTIEVSVDGKTVETRRVKVE